MRNSSRGRGEGPRRSRSRGLGLLGVAEGSLLATGLIVALLALSSSEARAQIADGTLDDFQDGTTMGWVASLGAGLPPVPPAAIAGAGPTGPGDFALRLTATGAPFAAGGKLVVNNVDPRWTGDFITAGVDTLVVDVNNPNPFPLTLRVGIDEPPAVNVGGRWVSPGVVVPGTSGWIEVELSLEPEVLLAGDVLATDVNATLENVGVIRIFHSTAATYQGDAIAAQLDVDNIEAVPEPSFLFGLVVGGFFIRSLGAMRRQG